LRELRDKET
jgi:hypothetical protein